MAAPLRHQLYNALNSLKKLGGVIVAHEGEDMICNYVYNVQRRRYELNIINPGEYYRVNCPFCNDTRHRLWINHRWGYKDEKTGSCNLWLAICYNQERCLQTYARQLNLWNQLFDNTYDRSRDVIRRGESIQIMTEVSLPGECYPVDYLAKEFPDDPAVGYLISRGYDPIYLGETYRVSVCSVPSSRYWHLTGRIIIPVYMDGKLYGWQARFVGDPPNKQTPKYFSMPGMKKTQLLYNFDVAAKFPFVVVCEGATDVWRFGPEAVALFGKSISTTQLLRLKEVFGKRGLPIVILLDGDAIDEAEGIAMELSGKLKGDGYRYRNAVVQLPPGKDPDSYSTDELRALVAAQCRQQGIELPI